MRDDQIGEIGHGGGCCGAQSGAEIVPERDTELLTGLHQSVESISAIVAACCAADFGESPSMSGRIAMATGSQNCPDSATGPDPS